MLSIQFVLLALNFTVRINISIHHFYIHFIMRYFCDTQAPSSVVAYYQQVGRAGRAVPTAFGVLISGEEDANFHEHCRETAFPAQDDIRMILVALSRSPAGLSEEEIQDKCNIRPREIVQVSGLITTRNMCALLVL